MIVRINGDSVIEYDRDKPLPAKHAEYLDKMDRSMDRGIEMGRRSIDAPDAQQRLEFVAGQLFHALQTESDGVAAAMCSYIANRWPDAAEVRFTEAQGDVSIEILVGEGESGHGGGIPVQFH